MTAADDTPTHKTSDRMAELAERWAAGVAAAREAEARRVAALAAEAEAALSDTPMRDAVRAAQDQARQDGQR